MSQQIQPVKTDEQVASVAALAGEIWNQHYVSIIGREQVDYMLEKFQSVAAVKSQIASGYEYYLALVDDEPMGYIGLVPDESSGKMMLSKIYVKESCRGTGLGTALLEFTKNRAVEKGSTSIWLTVNRNNVRTMEWYDRKGFAVVGEVKQDIGSEFYMDDYILEYSLG